MTTAAHVVQPLQPGDLPEVLDLDAAAFVYPPDPDASSAFFEWDRTFGVRAGPVLVGLQTTLSLTLALPDAGTGTRAVPMAGLTWVAVHPGHRRRGVLSALIRHHLHLLHEQGAEAISGLNASEPVIYGRFGYGLSTTGLRLEVPRGAQLREPGAAGDDVSVRFETARAEQHAELVHGLRAAVAERRPGSVGRPPALSRHLLADTPRELATKEPKRLLVAERAGRPVGYALLRRTPQWTERGPGGTVTVHEHGALDVAAAHRLWRTLLDLDLMATTTVDGLADDDPLLQWLVDVRATRPVRADRLWVRVVDVDRAVTARGYGSDLDVVLAVTDALCPWNARRWRVRSRAGEEVTCTPTTDAADVALDVRELGPLLVGGVTALALATAGLLHEQTAGAVAALTRAMRSPLCPASGYDF